MFGGKQGIYYRLALICSSRIGEFSVDVEEGGR
jgi:hypothetical protein